ncbi:MAG: hypothetical protein WC461_01620 [Candidatus Paceibacterota bacterium]
MEGIYEFLYWCPMWAVAGALYFLVIGILFIIRDWQEGLPYNISVASQQGDLALIVAILIGVEILKRQQSLPEWMGTNFQFILFAVSVSFGLLYQLVVFFLGNKWGTAADAFHNMFIAPLLLFMLVTTVPVTVLYGVWFEKTCVIFCLLVWLLTLLFDIIDGRLQQPEWHADHGIDLPLCRVRRRDRLGALLGVPKNIP